MVQHLAMEVVPVSCKEVLPVAWQHFSAPTGLCHGAWKEPTYEWRGRVQSSGKPCVQGHLPGRLCNFTRASVLTSWIGSIEAAGQISIGSLVKIQDLLCILAGMHTR